MEDLTQIQVDGGKLKAARERVRDGNDAPLSLSLAARRVGLARQTLWNIENNVHRPNADTLARLCALYGVGIADLTTGAQVEATAA